MNQSEVTGKLFEIQKEQQISENFKKRVFVIELIERDPKYNQYIPFELFQDKCDVIDAYVVGETVTVTYNLKGKEYNGKYYPSLNAWKIKKS